jgi:hypothetical protein
VVVQSFNGLPKPPISLRVSGELHAKLIHLITRDHPTHLIGQAVNCSPDRINEVLPKKLLLHGEPVIHVLSHRSKRLLDPCLDVLQVWSKVIFRWRPHIVTYSSRRFPLWLLDMRWWSLSWW